VLSAALLGFLLGIRHATDPDHVAAIAALVARHRRVGFAARIGAAWGLGHSLTILAVGGVLVALRIAAPPQWTIGAELLVAAILVVLGIANLRELGRPREAHPQRHALVQLRQETGLGRDYKDVGRQAVHTAEEGTLVASFTAMGFGLSGCARALE